MAKYVKKGNIYIDKGLFLQQFVLIPKYPKHQFTLLFSGESSLLCSSQEGEFSLPQNPSGREQQFTRSNVKPLSTYQLH